MVVMGGQATRALLTYVCLCAFTLSKVTKKKKRFKVCRGTPPGRTDYTR